MIIVIVILALALSVCAAYILLLKRDIYRLNESLKMIRNSDTNSRLTTETFDRNICELCNNINELLDKHREIIIKSERSNGEFRRAITNISHDLRTPLTSAIGYVQMLDSEQIPQGKRAEYSAVIEQRLKALSELMNNLFDYTRITEGAVEINMQSINVCNVLRDVLSAFYDDFTRKGFTVKADIPDKPVSMMCDGVLLSRIAQNLIRNALEHGCDLFELSVNAEIGEINFKNRIQNPENLDIDRMFDRFYTADASRSNGNAGLGLAIAKELAEGMWWRITAVKEGNILSVVIMGSNP